MADGTPYLDTSLTLREKYPDSNRLDHPDLEDVVKTTFAKGVITDFEVVSEDPFEVKSQVKVKGDWGESDYLPLFYHPKAQYWDDDEALATDYNKEKGYFEKAWMSFRGDDEVVVMLHEGEPVAAFGFSDGVPRVGEDVLQFECAEPFRWRVSVNEFYKSVNGPDGLNLKLLQESELIYDGKGPEYVDDQIDMQAYTRVATLHTETIELPPLVQSFFVRFGGGIKNSYSIDCKTTWNEQKRTARDCLRMNLVVIGPILYLIQSLWRGDWKIQDIPHSVDSIELLPSWVDDCLIYTFCIYPWGGCSEANPETFNNCNGEQGHITADAMTYVAAQNVSYVLDPLTLEEKNPILVSFIIYAALYTKKLYEATKANPPSVDWSSLSLNPDPPLGFTEQTYLNEAIADYFGGTDPKVDYEEGPEYFVRPHTKEELQEAGMWPAKGE